MDRPLAVSPSYDEAEANLALLAAPSRFGTSDSKTTNVRVECGDDGRPDECTIVDVSFGGLPLDINHRFKRLIELFNLEVVDSSADTIFLRSNRQEAEKALPSANASLPQGLWDFETTEIKPQWRLCIQAEATW